jgi:hypothetical protein
MTATKAQILDLMAKLPLAERREMVEHLYDVNIFGDSVVGRLSPSQRARLDDSIAQADRGAVVASETVFDELGRNLGLSRA